MNFNYCVHPRCLWLRRGSLGDTKGGCGSVAVWRYGSTAVRGFWKTSLTLRLIYYKLTGGEFKNQNFNQRQEIIHSSDSLEHCVEKRLSLPKYSKNSGQHGVPCICLLLLMFSKFNPDQLGQLLLSETDRWRNTSEKQLKSSEALNKSTLFTQHHLSVCMATVRACLAFSPKNLIHNSTHKNTQSCMQTPHQNKSINNDTVQKSLATNNEIWIIELCYLL